MKNLLKISLLALTLVLSNTLSAKDIDVKVNKENRLVVELANSQKGAELVLADIHGEVLFKDYLKSSSYKKALDLNEIPRGTYFLSIEREDSILTTVISKSNKGVIVNDENSKIFFKPFFKTVDGNKVKVSFTNPQYKDANFRVYDDNGIEVASSVNNDLVVKKTFDFSNVPSGKYTISLLVGDQVVDKTLDIK
ncbi:hypothetical protein [Zunongwangia sp.]|uniref:hypothetical protein n=1 Tax=Zunongwangia sp. TaxID=1965325 RepID=UPI003AA80B91